MTIDEAKYAVRSGATVMFHGVEYKAKGIITWLMTHGVTQGWRNSLYLVPLSGNNSTTQALVSDCKLKEPMAEVHNDRIVC